MTSKALPAPAEASPEPTTADNAIQKAEAAPEPNVQTAVRTTQCGDKFSA